MSSLSFRNIRHERWSQPLRQTDASLRFMTYGKVQPMEEPSWLQKLFRRR